MAYISFNDGTAKTLNNGMTTAGITPGSRFANWTPFTRRVGQSATGLGTGARYMFTFRIDYGASFEMRDIPNTSLGTALALIRHLQGGGTCTVATEDGVNSPYTNCSLDPEGDVVLSFQDPVTLTYTLTVSVINLSAADMLCTY